MFLLLHITKQCKTEIAKIIPRFSLHVQAAQLSWEATGAQNKPGPSLGSPGNLDDLLRKKQSLWKIAETTTNMRSEALQEKQETLF